MKVEAVGVEEGRGWEAEVEDEEVSARTEDAMHFSEGVRPGAHVAEAEGDGEGVEGVVGEGEVEGVCDAVCVCDGDGVLVTEPDGVPVTLLDAVGVALALDVMVKLDEGVPATRGEGGG